MSKGAELTELDEEGPIEFSVRVDVPGLLLLKLTVAGEKLQVMFNGR